MAALLDEDRIGVWSEFMRQPEGGEVFSLTKQDLRIAVNDIDAWIDANASSFNSAISQPARGALTTRQKVRLFLYVVRRRFEVT